MLFRNTSVCHKIFYLVLILLLFLCTCNCSDEQQAKIGTRVEYKDDIYSILSCRRRSPTLKYIKLQ